MTDNDNDRIDNLIARAASDYNRPPVTPREEMWAAIQAAKNAPGPRLYVTAGNTAATRGYSAARRFDTKWLGLAAAAALLVATGVGIGRWTSSPARDARQVAGARVTSPAVKGQGVVVAPDAPVSVAVQPSAGPPAEQDAPQSPATTRTAEEMRRNPVVIGTGGIRRLAAGNRQPMTGNRQPAAGNGQLATASYQLAVEQHLEDAETILTSFEIESRDEGMNAQFAGWAKGLLSNTRLLLDSPAGDDPRRARLLQDLELVLAQIVQLSPNAAATDRELIQGSIQNRNVLTRLRTAIPAGQPREITER